MSIKIMQRVWTLSEQSGSARLMLLAIADNCNDDGEGWPGIQHLVTKTKMSERQTQRLLMMLDQTNELAVEWGVGRGGSNYYYVLLGKSESEIHAIKAMVQQHNIDSGAYERVEKIKKSIQDHQKGDKMTPIEDEKGDNLTPIEDEKGDNLTPIKEPEKGQKGDIQDGKGVIFDEKGDIAMTPEPLNRHEPIKRDQEEPEKEPAKTSEYSPGEAWSMTDYQLRLEMGERSRPYLDYVKTLQVAGFDNGVFRLRAANQNAHDWVASRLSTKIRRLLEGIYNQPLELEIAVNGVDAIT